MALTLLHRTPPTLAAFAWRGAPPRAVLLPWAAPNSGTPCEGRGRAGYSDVRGSCATRAGPACPGLPRSQGSALCPPHYRRRQEGSACPPRPSPGLPPLPGAAPAPAGRRRPGRRPAPPARPPARAAPAPGGQTSRRAAPCRGRGRADWQARHGFEEKRLLPCHTRPAPPLRLPTHRNKGPKVVVAPARRPLEAQV